jgi:hypothetical protein
VRSYRLLNHSNTILLEVYRTDLNLLSIPNSTPDSLSGQQYLCLSGGSRNGFSRSRTSGVFWSLGVSGMDSRKYSTNLGSCYNSPNCVPCFSSSGYSSFSSTRQVLSTLAPRPQLTEVSPAPSIIACKAQMEFTHRLRPKQIGRSSQSVSTSDHF